MIQTKNILQIQREFLGDFDPMKDFKLTEMQQAYAEMNKLAKEERGRDFRLVNVIVNVIAEVSR